MTEYVVQCTQRTGGGRWYEQNKFARYQSLTYIRSLTRHNTDLLLKQQQNSLLFRVHGARVRYFLCDTRFVYYVLLGLDRNSVMKGDKKPANNLSHFDNDLFLFTVTNANLYITMLEKRVTMMANLFAILILAQQISTTNDGTLLHGENCRLSNSLSNNWMERIDLYVPKINTLFLPRLLESLMGLPHRDIRFLIFLATNSSTEP